MASVIQPDFARLKNNLVRSGLQTDNNALYQILDELIKQITQSQQATQQSISTIPGFGGITKASPSALTGDGTTANPLGVNVDGTTVNINGSNQLTVGTDFTLLRATYHPTFVNRLTTPLVLVTGVSGKTVVPIAWQIANQLVGSAGGYSAGLTLTIYYNCGGGVQPVGGLGNYAVTTTFGHSKQGAGAIPFSQMATDSTLNGIDLILKGNGDVTLVGAPTPTENNQVTIYYTMVTNVGY